MSKALARILDSPDLLSTYITGLTYLERSYVIDFLRERATVKIIDGGSDVQKAAAEAHRSLGYQQALDDLINFKEKFIIGAANKGQPLTPTFGAVDRAFQQNDLLPEEVDAIRTNSKPNYPNASITTVKI